jgi:hypothetical protein
MRIWIARRFSLAVGLILIMGMVAATPAAAVHRSAVSVSPGSLNFGKVPTYTTEYLLVYVTNTGKLPQVLLEYWDDSSVFYVEDDLASDECDAHDAYHVFQAQDDPGLLPGATCAFGLAFYTEDPGLYTGHFFMDWWSDIFHESVISTNLRGTGINP